MQTNSSLNKLYRIACIALFAILLPGLMYGQALTISTSSFSIEEGAGSSFTVALSAQPSSDVVVNISSANADVSFGATTLTFTSANYSTAQTVTFTCAEDADLVSETNPISIAVVDASSDDAFDGQSASIALTVNDNDAAGLNVTTGPLSVDEGSTDNSFTVALSAQPTSNVVINLSINNSDLVLSTSSLTFTSANWSVPQSVTFSCSEDSDLLDESGTIAVAVNNSQSDSQFQNLSSTITVNITDNDTAPVFTSTPVSSVNEDSQYIYDITVTDEDGDASSFSVVPNNTWLSITSTGTNQARLSGTPDNSHVGTIQVTITATDDLTSTSQTFDLTVVNTNDAPTFTSTAVTSATEDAVYTYNITASDIDQGQTPTFTLTTNPGWLSLTDNNDGTAVLTGTPTNSNVGNNNVVITVSDGSTSVTQAFTIVVANTNDAPTFVAFNPPTTIAEDSPYTYSISTSDVDGDTPTLTMPTGPAWLAITDNGNGTASLAGTPLNEHVGSHSVIIRASDGTTSTDVTFTITVTNVNDAPRFTSTAITTATEDVAYSYAITTVDDDGDAITITTSTLPGWLTFTDNTDGTATLAGTPTNANVGTFDVVLSATDAYTATTSQNFTITVNNVNDAPVISNISQSTPQNVALTITLASFAGDEDNNLDVSTLIVVSQPLNGSVAINSTSGEVTYTPNSGFSGNDSFTLQISDTDGATSNTGQISIQVSDEAPNAVNDSYTIDEDTPTVFEVLSNDTDPQNNINIASVTIITQPTHGTLTVNASGTVLYTPNSNYFGSDSFVYEVRDADNYSDQASVSITITAVNDAPNLATDSYTTNEDTPINMDVLSNDTDVENDVAPASIQIVTATANGTLTINADYTLRYVPNLNFNGSDSFTYSVQDEDGATSQANVSLTITAINDAPTFTSTPVESATEDIAYSYTITTNDVDGDVPIITATYPASATWLTFTNNNNGTASLTGTPTNNDVGTVEVTITISDASLNNSQTFNITVNNINDAPVFTSTAITSATEDSPYTYNVRANDIDANETPVITMETGPDWLTLTDLNTGNATLSGTPLNSHVGNHVVTLRAADGTTYVEQSFTITVANTNDAPVFTSTPIISINEDVVYNYSITTTDDDGDAMNIQGVVIPAWLTFTDNGNGTASLTGAPTNNEVGTHNVSLTVSDPTASTSQNFTIQIINVNDAPVLSNGNYSTPEDTPVSILFEDISEDVDGNLDNTSVKVIQQPANGSVSIDATTGDLTYTPNTHFSGTDLFTIQASDTDGANSNIATIEILVSNEAPNAVNDSYTIDEDTPSTFNVLENDLDPQGNNTINKNSLKIITQPTKGIVTVSTVNGTISYTPNSNVNGADSFTYEVCDTDGYCDQATVNITITPVNDAPIVTTDSYSTNEDTPFNMNVLENDADIENAVVPASIQIETSTINGTLTINTDFTVRYEPNLDFNGNDSFTYSVEDEDGLRSGYATVNITVTPVNDKPVAVNDVYETTDLSPINMDVTSNDSDVDGNLNRASVTITKDPAHGTITNISATGIITYEPDHNYDGSDTFEYQVCDTNGECATATVQLTITSINLAPITNPDYETVGEDGSLTITPLTNDSDPNGTLDNQSLMVIREPEYGTYTLNLANASIDYKPNLHYFGNDTIVYEVCDLAQEPLCAQDTIFITVLSVNDAPVAADYVLIAIEGTPVSVNLAELGTDVEMDNLTISIAPNAPSIPGIVSIVDQTTFVFTANIGSLCSTYEMDYILHDSNGGSDRATVTIQVLPIDSDNDNIPDAVENSNLDNVDSDNDGTPDYLDDDSDGDGLSDLVEGGITDLCNDLPLDTDNDGIPNYLDLDSDNDLVSDADEANEDCDNDGIPNSIDSFDNCSSRALDIPEVFVPGSSIEEYQRFIIKGAEDLVGDELFVFNRWGGQVYHSTDYDNSWRGNSASKMLGGEELPEGTYFYVYKTKEGQVIKGTVYIKR